MSPASPPLVSCIVPVFNGALYLQAALDSILAQTYRPLEIIVVDDGSTDGSADIIAAQTHPLRTLQQSNQGPAAARNTGIAIAQGDLVAFLDADDRWHPQKLARQMDRFRARPELAFCVTHVEHVWEPELQQHAERWRGQRITQPLPGYIPSALVARRDLFATVGRFDTAFRPGEDTEWFVRALEQRAVIEVLPDVLVYRRLHRDNLSWRLAPDRDAQLFRIIKAHLDRQRRAR